MGSAVLLPRTQNETRDLFRPHLLECFRADCLDFAAGSSTSFFGNCPQLIGLSQDDYASGNVRPLGFRSI